MLRRLLTLATHRIYSLPILVLMPHSRCNCRCVMCDIWKANHQKKEIAVEQLMPHVISFKKLGVREAVLSGGEPLMHSNLWKLCALLGENNIRITLLSTGLLLDKNASHIVRHLDEVIVSLDGSEEVHDRIRNIPDGYRKLKDGVQALKKLKKNFKVSGRCVIQRHNYFDLVGIVRASKQIGLDKISFLAADISSTAFNRPQQWNHDRVSEIALSPQEVMEFDRIVEQSFVELRSDYHSRFISESPQKMKRIVQYYYAVNGIGNYPAAVCNAPWVSAVVESDGSLLPCFFHKPYGNIFDAEFLSLLNSPAAINFRKNLKMDKDETCKKCVCSLKLGVTQMT